MRASRSALLLGVVSLAALVACGGVSSDKPQAYGDTCYGSVCDPDAAAVDHYVPPPKNDDDDDVGEGDALLQEDPWKGDRLKPDAERSFVGTFKAPDFYPDSPLMDRLTTQAKLHFYFEKFDYVGMWMPNQGVSYDSTIPLVDASRGAMVMVEDVDDQGGLVSTWQPVDTFPNNVTQTSIWELGVMKRVDLEAIFASAGLEINPNKAQLLFTFFNPPAADKPGNSGGGVANAVINEVEAQFEAILIADEEGNYAIGNKTTKAGVALIANVTAPRFPGTMRRVTYTYDVQGEPRSHTLTPQRAMAGAVTRITIATEQN